MRLRYYLAIAVNQQILKRGRNILAEKLCQLKHTPHFSFL